MKRISESTENYLKAIYIISKKKKGGWVSNREIAVFLNVNPASVSNMLHKLNDNNLIQWKPRSSLRLKPEGKKIAQDLVSNYNRLYSFFQEVLNVSNSMMIEQLCCKIEHHMTSEVSNALLELIALETIEQN